MGFILVKKICSLLFLLIAGALLSTSFAGRVSKLVEPKDLRTTAKELETWEPLRHYEAVSDQIHERLLKVKTNDYGRSDPPPALVKPPFKLIPN